MYIRVRLDMIAFVFDAALAGNELMDMWTNSLTADPLVAEVIAQKREQFVQKTCSMARSALHVASETSCMGQ